MGEHGALLKRFVHLIGLQAVGNESKLINYEQPPGRKFANT